MTSYTPTTEWIRIMVGYSKTTATDRTLPIEEARAEGYAWFDRWLTDHDERLRKEALRDARAAVAELLSDPSNYTSASVTGVIYALAKIDEVTV